MTDNLYHIIKCHWSKKYLFVDEKVHKIKLDVLIHALNTK